MADCGAAGTVLDRAARSILFASNTGNSRQLLANIIDHAGRSSTVSGTLATLPLHSPDTITLPYQVQTTSHPSQDIQANPTVQNKFYSHNEVFVPSHPHVLHPQQRISIEQANFQNFIRLQQQHANLQHRQDMMMQQQIHHRNMMIQNQREQELRSISLGNKTAVSEKVEVGTGHEGLVQNVDFSTLRDSCFALLRDTKG
jgi:hypothetical protein